MLAMMRKLNQLWKDQPRSAALIFAAGLACGILAMTLCMRGALWVRGPSSGEAEPFFAPLLKQASADLEEGDYDFFPNRRSVWIVNRTNGRMANYFFHDDELGSVDRSRVATIKMESFPRKDTVLRLSDRNLNNILWVCNVRTGDVQMWHVGRDGALRAEPPIASSTDLTEKTPPSGKN
jgi:hypothetical protein